ncbi:MAG TPA: SPFH domain-containing protein, partial [Tissierellia bacterium]|nr:SPFH domain-containing protein [Tissierellia bacterium]
MNGMFMLLLNIALMLGSVLLFIFSMVSLHGALQIITSIISCLYFSIVGPILFAGLKVLKPNEALVLTLFGKYYGTLKGEGFYFVNPFVTAVNPATNAATTAAFSVEASTDKKNPDMSIKVRSKKTSLKTMTLNNEKQKINDLLGNPITIGIVVVWRVVNTAKAVFNVDNYTEYLSIQCDSALRNIVRLYPYDTFGDDNEKTLRGSSLEIANKLKEEIQEKVEVAGLEIIEARITHLAYAPEIAAAML